MTEVPHQSSLWYDWGTSPLIFVYQERPSIPAVPWMKRQKWLAACDLHDTIGDFKGIHEDLTKTPASVHMGSVEVGCSKQS